MRTPSTFHWIIRITLLCSMFVSALGCDDRRPSAEEFPAKENPDWFVFEGRIPLDDRHNLYQVLSLKPGSEAGTGLYHLEEFSQEDGDLQKIGEFSGRYSTYVFDDPGRPVEVHLQNSSQITGVTRVYPSENGKRIRQEQFRKKDLVLARQSDDILQVLDYRHEPISTDVRFMLIKRTSIVFTVEGKFAHTGDSSVFYETNTDQVWPVAKMGAYDQAIRQYHQLANTKNEGIYLKATGYSVRLPKAGRDALVLKKIINMSSAAVFE